MIWNSPLIAAFLSSITCCLLSPVSPRQNDTVFSPSGTSVCVWLRSERKQIGRCVRAEKAGLCGGEKWAGSTPKAVAVRVRACHFFLASLALTRQKVRVFQGSCREAAKGAGRVGVLHRERERSRCHELGRSRCVQSKSLDVTSFLPPSLVIQLTNYPTSDKSLHSAVIATTAAP